MVVRKERIPALTMDVSTLKILVSDPSQHMTSLVATMLRTLKVKVIREVNEASKTIAELSRRDYDVLILDDGLKDFSSLAFVKKLRGTADCPLRNIPIIMMSGGPSATAIKAARDAGVTEFVRKPFSAEILKLRLEAIFNAPRPFIEASAYKGPDRRRRKRTYSGTERRQARSEPTPAG